jgi:hypothetical protein
MLSDTVEKIGRLLSEVAAMQRPHVARICSQCEDPCCNRVHYLFTEKDTLWLTLSGQKRKWRREAVKTKGCWFLGPAGCLLEPAARPFICHRYLCPELEAGMEAQAPGLVAALRKRFKAMDELRSEMWRDYLDER